ncbi:LysR substrate-binding domain-containing protein [Caulobacter mirabilis]|nr:LysR substrate-binding domain-containing protein [Caulobacter mirabilis]
MTRLPPFIAMRALEAAARHRSYSRAAAELNVTHGAVSQQIRRLEEELGARLFTRDGNAMEPTEAALKLAAQVAQAIDLMRSGVETLVRGAATESPLVLSTVHAFAGRWLTHRMSRMPAEVGQLELNVDQKLSNFVTDGVDAAIRHGKGPWPGVESVHLFTESFFVVGSPEFLDRHPVRSMEDIAKVPLLHHTGYPWNLWFEGHGLRTPRLPRGARFDDSAVLTDACLQGLGLALVREWLVEQDIRAGRLLKPLPGSIKAEAEYCFVWRADSAKLPRIMALRDWLLEEARVAMTRCPDEGLVADGVSGGGAAAGVRRQGQAAGPAGLGRLQGVRQQRP